MLDAFIEKQKPEILIIKTSSLGDIIQAFAVLNYLLKVNPGAECDWVVEERFASIVSAHPLVRNTIAINSKGFKQHFCEASFWRSQWQAIARLRRKRYDVIFDLQGNCKSGILTFLSRSSQKIGFGRKSVREWPNVLFTNLRFEVLRSSNIRLQYISLVQQYLGDCSKAEIEGVRFKIDSMESLRLKAIMDAVELKTKMRIMVCPGSRWINKQLPTLVMAAFLKRIEKVLGCSFLLMWGSEEEKGACLEIQRQIPKKSIVVDRLTVPCWQNLMGDTDLVIAVDSSALHLCGTTSTPTFSIFGPTSPEIFKPVGRIHHAIFGKCPYGKVFEKQCPLLRNCPTGACIRELSFEAIFDQFWIWWSSLSKSI